MLSTVLLFSRPQPCPPVSVFCPALVFPCHCLHLCLVLVSVIVSTCVSFGSVFRFIERINVTVCYPALRVQSCTVPTGLDYRTSLLRQLRHVTRQNLKVQKTHKGAPTTLATLRHASFSLLTYLYEYRDLSNRAGYAATQVITFSSILKVKARNVYHGCYVTRNKKKHSNWPSLAKIASHLHKVENISTRIAWCRYPQCTKIGRAHV